MQNAKLDIYAPASGTVVTIQSVPDPAFSEGMLGDGIAINPAGGVIYAPFDGVVESLNQNLHAVMIKQGAVSVLIHIGVDTVNLRGKGFKSFIKQGDSVKKGDKLLEFDPVFIAKNAASNLVIVTVSEPFGAQISKLPPGQVKAAGDIVFSVALEGAPDAAPQAAAWLNSAVITIENKNGLHARPAGALARAAAKFESKIEILFNANSADAKSVGAVMALGVSAGDTLQLRASGSDAEAALSALTNLINQGLGEGSPAAAPLRGGVLLGKALVYKEEEPDIAPNFTSVEQEEHSLKTALALTQRALEEESASFGPAAAEIMQAHITILRDPALYASAVKFIENGQNAAQAFKSAAGESMKQLQSSSLQIIKERTADYKDILIRVLYALAGKERAQITAGPDTILITREILPNNAALLDKNIIAVICAQGSETSHAAIMLRNKGVCALMNAGESILQTPNGTPVIVNCTDKTFVINPPQEQQNQTLKIMQESAQEAALATQHAFEPAVTKDGVLVKVGGNAGSAEETAAAAQNGADAMGLVRTEFIFARRQSAPSEEEQFKVYGEILSAARGKSVVFRLLDVGGDKPLAFVNLPKEDNPIMGLRGVRNYKDNFAFITAQIRALLRLSPQNLVHIMIPMVSAVSEIGEVAAIIERERKNLGVTEKCALGIMVEVPGVALMADAFAAHADFFSIGTNDLTQYALAADRTNSALSALSSVYNPGVLALIERTAANKAGVPTAVCGAAASETAAVPLLLGLGVRELACAGNMIPAVKALVRKLDAKHCRAVALNALTLQSAAEVKELIKKEFGI